MNKWKVIENVFYAIGGTFLVISVFNLIAAVNGWITSVAVTGSKTEGNTNGTITDVTLYTDSGHLTVPPGESFQVGESLVVTRKELDSHIFSGTLNAIYPQFSPEVLSVVLVIVGVIAVLAGLASRYYRNAASGGKETETIQ